MLSKTANNLFLLLLLVVCGCARPAAADRLVVYCAHDREFAEEILQDFARRTGLEVVTRYDTEANKAVGLKMDLVREASRPRCDVHWNNEILATIFLQQQGIYQPYASPAAASFPAMYRAADQTWTAFAARARVLLVNTQKIETPADAKGPSVEGMMDLLDPRWHGQVVMAKPQFGTTATHAACLFQVWGEKRAKAFFEKLRDNGVHLLPGNKQVAEAVGRGQFAIGLTDTDDAMAEIDAGHPVRIIFPDRTSKTPDLGTLFIPNTVAIINNCPNPEGARKLVDYLLSEEVEAKLARAQCRQIPLNPRVKVDLPKEIATPQSAKSLEVDFTQAAQLWEITQKTLSKIFALP